jgi:hypothetical protein
MTLESDLKRYEAAELGMHFIETGEKQYLEGAANTLRNSLHEDAAPAINLLVEGGQVEPFLAVYAQKGAEVLGSAKVGDLAGLYKDLLYSVLPKEKAKKIQGLFGTFGGELYGDIRKKVIKANHDLEGVKKGVELSEDELEGAKETIEKYEAIFDAMSLLRNLKREKLRPRATRESIKGDLEKIAESL